MKRSTVVVVVTCGLFATGCTSGASPAGSDNGTATGHGSATLGRTSVVLAGAKQEVAISTPSLTPDQSARLSDLGKLGMPVAIGRPNEVSVQGSLPAGGATLTRTYPAALPADAAATFAYYDDSLGAWRAVPSSLSPDRRTLTATVHHLSLWTDITASAGAALEKASNWAYDQLGKVLDSRVEPPQCLAHNPAWIPDGDAVYIATDKANPILFCTGHDGRTPDLLVLKARVNRGYGYSARLSGRSAWAYNSTESHPGEIAELVRTVTDLDHAVTDPLNQLFANGVLVGPGQEISYGMTQDAAAGISPGDPALTLTPLNGYGFLTTLAARLVVGDVLDQAQGAVATAVALATCANDIREIRDPATAYKAASACINELDARVAGQLGQLLQHFTDPKTGVKYTAETAGKLAGRLVGLVSITAAIAYPILTYIGDRSLPQSARTIVLSPRQTVASVSLATLMTAEVPADCQKPAQRLVGGRLAHPEPGEGMLTGPGDPGKTAPWSGIADFAGRGSNQILGVYLCSAGGVSWPEVVLLVGPGGKLISSVDLGDISKSEHATVQALTVNGSSATITWASYEGAGFNKRMHRSIVAAPGGHLKLTEDTTATTLGIPTVNVIAAPYARLDTDTVDFASPSGKLLCGFTNATDPRTGTTVVCQGGGGAPASADAACQAKQIGVIGPSLEAAAGWQCAGGIMFTAASDNEPWWTGQGFPTATSLGMTDQAVLPYGYGLRVGDITCVSQRTGVTCLNSTTGARFSTNGAETTFSGATRPAG